MLSTSLLHALPEAFESQASARSLFATLLAGLTIRSTTFDSRVNENSAAAEMLTTPATVVANRMDISTGSMLSPLFCRDAAVKCRSGALF
jgi:hypothetical protein